MPISLLIKPIAAVSYTHLKRGRKVAIVERSDKMYGGTCINIGCIPTKTLVHQAIETLSFHFALIGFCYIFAVGISKVFALIPGFIGSSMSGLMFMNGMIAAYIVKFLMKKLNIDFLQEDVLQTKITGWTADYLVVCAFMAVGFQVLGSWVVPIIVESLIITVVTFIVCFYFGQRIGGSNDFERTLGLYGTSTGTVPSGIALVRIVDPEFKTSTAVELGLMNLVMLLSTPVYLVLLAMASGDLSTTIAMLILAGLCIVYLIVMKLTGTWGKKTFDWKNKEGRQKNGYNLLWRTNSNYGKSK